MKSEIKRRTPIEWPNKAYICVCTTIAFEAFRFHGHYTTGPGQPPGKPNYFSLSYADYGAKVGIWRVFDVLEKRDESDLRYRWARCREAPPHR